MLRMLAKVLAALALPLRDMSLSILIPSLILLFGLLNVNSSYIGFNGALLSLRFTPLKRASGTFRRSPRFEQGLLMP